MISPLQILTTLNAALQQMKYLICLLIYSELYWTNAPLKEFHFIHLAFFIGQWMIVSLKCTAIGQHWSWILMQP